MVSELADEELDLIWDDESGAPSPVNATEIERRLGESSKRLRQEIRKQETQNAELAELVIRYTQVLQALKAEAERADSEQGQSPIETRRLRDTLLRLAENSVAVARML